MNAHYIGNGRNRSKYDFYPTPRAAIVPLLNQEEFPGSIWEPACGDGAICSVLQEAGHVVIATDLYDHGYGQSGKDFFQFADLPAGCQSIITNTPFSSKKQPVESWIEHALSMPHLEKMALLMKTTAIAGQKRSRVLEQSPLAKILQFRGRLPMFNGEGKSMIDFAWFVFDVLHQGPPTIHWIEQSEALQISLFDIEAQKTLTERNELWKKLSQV